MDKFLDEIWGINRLFVDSGSEGVASGDESVILLCVDNQNFDRFFGLESFKAILNRLKMPLNLYGIQKSQIGVINGLRTLQISRFEVLENLLLLKNENIINDEKFSQISDFINAIELIESEIINPKNMQSGFYKNIQNLNEIADEIAVFEPKILESKKRANENKFTISVTGVINAGKSSMLNAMLNSQILGTSNIPETANLTLLEYADTPRAEVIFYDQDECELLGIDKSPENRVIDPANLLEYTSAKFEISKYVKMIKLGLNSEFLSDNIDIVDTPGLDDSVVLRENLTKYFMAKSDAIIHLMNAAQSATNKDMSFITQTLKNSKNGRLIVVLTHADMLSSSELMDALNYTKNAINADLQSYDFDKNLIDEVKFFAIDSLSGRGVGELKNFIYTEFFGENSKKAKLILSNYKKDLTLVSDDLIEKFKFNLSNLSIKSEEILAQNDELNAEISALENEIKEAENEIKTALNKLDYSDEKLPLKSQILVIRDRILSDVKYAKANKQKVDFNRIGVILSSGINDAIIDIFRGFSQRIAKDIDNISAILGAKFGVENGFKFDTKSFFDEKFNELNFDNVVAQISNLIKQNSDLNALGVKMESEFDKFLGELDLKNTLQIVAKNCTSEFENSVKSVFEHKKALLENKQKDLNEILANLNQNSEISKEKIITLKSDLAKIVALKQRIEQ